MHKTAQLCFSMSWSTSVCCFSPLYNLNECTKEEKGKWQVSCRMLILHRSKWTISPFAACMFVPQLRRCSETIVVTSWRAQSAIWEGRVMQLQIVCTFFLLYYSRWVSFWLSVAALELIRLLARWQKVPQWACLFIYFRCFKYSQ